MVNTIPFLKGERIHLEISGLNENMLSDGLKVTLYRILQEQLTNVVKHSCATSIHIKLIQNEYKLTLLIEDNGQGFDVKTKRKGIGLSNIIARAELYNGRAIIESTPGAGCTVLVILDIS